MKNNHESKTSRPDCQFTIFFDVVENRTENFYKVMEDIRNFVLAHPLIVSVSNKYEAAQSVDDQANQRKI